MFRKKKEVVKSFDEKGKQITDEDVKLLEDAPSIVPDLEIPPTAALKYEGCFICHEDKYYKDATGVWHNCPRCNKLNRG